MSGGTISHGPCATRQSLTSSRNCVKKIVLPSGENVGEPSFAGPETTPGAKTCGLGADEVNPSASWGNTAMQSAAQSDAKTRPSIWRCINNTVKLQRCFVILDSKPSDQTFIPFPTDYLTVHQLSRYLDEGMSGLNEAAIARLAQKIHHRSQTDISLGRKADRLGNEQGYRQLPQK